MAYGEVAIAPPAVPMPGAVPSVSPSPPSCRLPIVKTASDFTASVADDLSRLSVADVAEQATAIAAAEAVRLVAAEAAHAQAVMAQQESTPMDTSEPMKTEVKSENPADLNLPLSDPQPEGKGNSRRRRRRGGRGKRGGIMQKEKEQILSQMCPLRREWTWTARRGWFEAAVAYRLKSERRGFKKLEMGVTERGRMGRAQRQRLAEARRAEDREADSSSCEYRSDDHQSGYYDRWYCQA